MKPLNYAILKFFTKMPSGSVVEIMEHLYDDYINFKSFNKKSIVNALMTAEANGLIEEIDMILDKNGELVIYYRANDEGKETINTYIED